ncbi:MULTISPECIES: helix-turn-helix domain-containing protein [Streptomyces]|uniref:helix-turn-helix domain-containing protein n=1 Tax=Streptomyces TaxID=1883 RepID=UPI0009A51F98|nr:MULTISPECIES: helix-turn-helix domain-containing protein [Streptomyces]
MGLAGRRKTLGYSQEKLAELLGVDRTTVGRWERGKIAPQPCQRPALANALDVSLPELEGLLPPSRTVGQGDTRQGPTDQPRAGDIDEMIRREFLRILTVSGALTVLPLGDVEARADGVPRSPADFARMNRHLWQVYQLARTKGTVYPVVRDQLTTLKEALSARRDGNSLPLLNAAADLFQLAGEVAFDANRYTDAAASYTLAASVGKEAQAYDLWACALVRQAYLDVSEQRYREAADVLRAAERIAARGDTTLSTRHWVASVQAEVLAGLGDLGGCERALDRADEVRNLSDNSSNGGWLRFDGTRLAEERGARYVQLGRFDQAEEVLTRALERSTLAVGHSYRRRGAVLVDLAVIGAKRQDPDQVVAYALEALNLAQASASGYIARRLRSLCNEFGPLSGDHRVAGLEAEIASLKAP